MNAGGRSTDRIGDQGLIAEVVDGLDGVGLSHVLSCQQCHSGRLGHVAVADVHHPPIRSAISSALIDGPVIPLAHTTAMRATPPMPAWSTSPLSGQDSWARKAAAGAQFGRHAGVDLVHHIPGMDISADKVSECAADSL